MATEKKERILLVHNYYQIPGGEDTVVANEKRLLETHGHEVSLYSRSNEEITKFSFWRKLLLPMTAVFSWKTYREIKSIIRERNVDIVHVHNTLSLISPSVFYAAFHCKVPVVQTLHNFRMSCPNGLFYRNGTVCEECVQKGLFCALKHRCYRDSLSQTMAGTLILKIHRLLGTYRRVNFLCLTEFNKEKLLQLNRLGKRRIVDPDKIYIKPNFTFAEDTEGLISPVNGYFLYAGRIDETKGIKILFDAWRLLGEKAPDLIVCGTGPLVHWCEDFVARNGLNTIKMKGSVPNSKIKELLRNAVALILPTQLYEGFPMSILEAFSQGIPVVASKIGNAGAIVSEGITGSLFAPESSFELADAAMRVCTYSNIRQSVKAVYEDIYSEEKNYSKLKHIYEAAKSDY